MISMKLIYNYSVRIIYCILFCTITFLSTNDCKGQNANGDPLKKTSFQWGSTCSACYNSTNSYRVNFLNVSGNRLDVKLAVQEKTFKWRTFILNDIAAGDSVSAYACDGTGKYSYWTRIAGDKNTVFPTDDEIVRELNKQK